MRLRPDCKKCGTPFTEDNTYWYTHSISKKQIRKCRNCTRLKFAFRAPLPRFFVGPVVGTVECYKCEPWAGKACSECHSMWVETLNENSYAEAM